MSEQVGGILQMGPSYQYKREQVKNYKTNKISPQKFYSWQKDSMYKSTYNQHHSYNSNHPNNSIIPGYQGYLPSVRSSSLYGKGINPTSKQSFNSDRLDQNRTGLATTGFNITKQAFIDKSKNGSSSKYGKSQIQRSHPNWDQNWKTSSQISYIDPKKEQDPVYRETEKRVQAEKPYQKASGYSQNHAYLDGYGWNPNKILKGANSGSEYRNRFNPEQEYHRATEVPKERKLKRKELNYQYNY